MTALEEGSNQTQAAPPVQSPILEDTEISALLSKVDQAGIPYVSWKNNHELETYLQGHGDLDVFVKPDRRAAFVTVALQEGWVELENPVARFPSVCHLFRAGSNGRLYHLHVYFRVVTGESWLKEYILPLDDFLLSNRERSRNTGIWVLNGEAQRYLFALRHLLKGGSISSRWLYRRELASYRHEWAACGGPEGWTPDAGPVELSCYLTKANLYGDKIRLPSVGAALRLRHSLWPFLRVAGWTLSARRVVSFLMRAANKVFWKQKKVFPRGGLVIAISGVDGAGKSTMLRVMREFFSGFVTVEPYQLGRPQGRILEFARRLVARRRRGGDGRAGRASSNRATSFPRAVAASVLAWVRLRTAQRAVRAARRGRLVLVDRWPSAELGKMDGPRIAPGNSSPQRMVEGLGRFERWAYSRMPRADVCVVLTVSLESALARNRDRVKEEKESDEDIRRRFGENQAVKPIANKVIRFCNEGEFDVMREQLTETIWAEVACH
ncbi:hypothetical protein LRF89_12540 [Halorhodospira sp. 9621]|uniref:hypothetical protein n=1 Tax=Halorhodospira sp. 9621 TaxID=2899135 RepID=UPI001EE91CF0|nr:hypothetical protein [Halorhodospira sp. 9621]MCG5534263.1 hypothetical protein [Halorhodospira sp. 9621]